MADSQPSPASQTNSSATRLLRWGLVFGLLLVVLVGVWLYWPPKISEAQRRTFNRANALLENAEDLAKGSAQLAEAIDLFETLRRELPNEPALLRNLAIARLLDLKVNKQPDVPAALLIKDELLAGAPSAAAFYLASQILLASQPDAGDAEVSEQTIQLLRQAVERYPEDVVLWRTLYLAAQNAANDSQDAGRALNACFRLAPENTHVFPDLLLLQAEQKSPDVSKTLTVARQVMESLAGVVAAEINGGPDVMRIVEGAESGAEQQNWAAITRAGMQLRNVTYPLEVSKSDLARLEPHPLEMMQWSLSETPAIKITAELSPWEFTLANSTPPRNDSVRDMAAADMDLDGVVEIITLSEQAVEVWRHDGQLSNWRILMRHEVAGGVRLLLGDLDYDITAAAANTNAGNAPQPTPDANPADTSSNDSAGACSHEADMDVVVLGRDGVSILRNTLDDAGGRILQAVEQSPETLQLRELSGGVLVDYDHDADLDLIAVGADGVQLLLSRGNMTFANESRWSVLPSPSLAIHSLTAVDWDRDADLDVVMFGETECGVLENLRHGRFRWSPFPAELQVAASRGGAVGEFDGNASWDFVAVNDQQVSTRMTVSLGFGRIQALQGKEVPSQGATSIKLGDLNNDGWLDVVAAGAGEAGVELMVAADASRSVQCAAKQLPAGAREIQLADLDQDGDLDLLALTQDGVQLLLNQLPAGNQWLKIKAVGQADNAGRAGHTGIGSVIEIRSGERYQARIVEGQMTHFGLNKQPQADALRILWTNGVPQTVLHPAANIELCERMTLKGSCPYLYCWDGEQFAFVTDCLWAAPLGLQSAPGQLTPSRSWEYLKVPGEMLQARDGQYVLQLTEELWEIAYFDQVELIAIDHPANIEIYSNEKVGPPSIAEEHVHTVRRRRLPVQALSQTGADVLPLLAARDDEYLRPFARKIRQGLTEPHYFELDLGDLNRPRKITLFLTGWIYPTNTSLNIAFGQNPEQDGPRLPWIETIDENGQWREAIAYTGFPGGKTKTIAIDLSQAFATSDYRLRVHSSAELYWDEAFFTVDEPDAEYRRTVLALTDADLHYRGFSQRVPYADHRPERYRYDQVLRQPQWPPIDGRFTRYGDVRPLVLHADDQMVVCAPGDELTLRFQADDPPPPGWTRDFFLHAVGWDKDADLNTYHGQSSEPLPFHAMKQYPYEPEQAFPDTPAHRAYLRTYQTRRQNPAAFWKQLLEQASDE